MLTSCRRFIIACPHLLEFSKFAISGTSRSSITNFAKYLHTTTQYQCQFVEKNNLPSKETLLRIDWLFEHQIAGIFKSRLNAFFDACEENVTFEDKLYKYNLKLCSLLCTNFSRSKAEILNHITKLRIYFRYKSPFNKVEHAGSCVYEGENSITVLWKLSTLQSSFWTYFPTFLRGKEVCFSSIWHSQNKIDVTEGALDVYVTNEGKIFRLVNRKVTAADREGARVMELLKTEGAANRKSNLEAELKSKLNENVVH